LRFTHYCLRHKTPRWLNASAIHRRVKLAMDAVLLLLLMQNLKRREPSGLEMGPSGPWRWRSSSTFSTFPLLWLRTRSLVGPRSAVASAVNPGLGGSIGNDSTTELPGFWFYVGAGQDGSTGRSEPSLVEAYVGLIRLPRWCYSRNRPRRLLFGAAGP